MKPELSGKNSIKSVIFKWDSIQSYCIFFDMNANKVILLLKNETKFQWARENSWRQFVFQHFPMFLPTDTITFNIMDIKSKTMPANKLISIVNQHCSTLILFQIQFTLRVQCPFIHKMLSIHRLWSLLLQEKSWIRFLTKIFNCFRPSFIIFAAI